MRQRPSRRKKRGATWGGRFCLLPVGYTAVSAARRTKVAGDMDTNICQREDSALSLGVESASSAYLNLARTFKQPRASARIVWACIVSFIQFYKFTAGKRGYIGAGWGPSARHGLMITAAPKRQGLDKVTT